MATNKGDNPDAADIHGVTMDKWERCDGYDGTEQIAVCPCCQAAAEEIERLESMLAWIENHEPQLVEAARKKNPPVKAGELLSRVMSSNRMRSSMPQDTLAMWTVYDHPTDYPDKFVARRFDIDANGAQPSSSIIIAADLETLRHILIVDMGLSCLTRSPDDDPKIVETWL